MMKFRSFNGLACAAIAIAIAMSSAAAQDGEKVTKTFEQAIPNIPANHSSPLSLTTLLAGRLLRIRTRNLLSFSPMSCPEKSSRK